MSPQQPGREQEIRARADVESKLYDSIAAFNAVACWDVLRLAQMRQYLAEHLAETVSTDRDAAVAAAVPGRQERYATALLRASERYRSVLPEGPDPIDVLTDAAMAVADAEQAADFRSRRGDAVEQWLRQHLDSLHDDPDAWNAVDDVWQSYRLHADKGIPLTEHVCEGLSSGYCQHLEASTEAPAESAGMDATPAREQGEEAAR